MRLPFTQLKPFNMEIFLGVITVILLYVTFETVKLKQKEKENERKRKQQKTGSPRKSYRKTNRSSGKTTNSK